MRERRRQAETERELAARLHHPTSHCALLHAAARSSKAQLYADNGAVFWTEPDNAPNFEAQPKCTPVARLTVKTGDAVNAVVNAQ